ncbi:MAG: hypothetical protein ACYCX4_13240 [Bacillota bacterium]
MMDNGKFQDLMLEHFGKVLTKLDGMESRLSGVESRLDSVESHLDSVETELSKVNQSQARMEHEHGEKLAALAEGQQVLMETLAGHTEILNDHTTRLERIEEKVSVRQQPPAEAGGMQMTG